MVVEACQSFQFFRQKPGFLKTIELFLNFIWDFALLN